MIFVLTGAGLSAESGLGTFRDAGGLWSRYDLEEVATPRGFAANPHLVHDFYNARRANAAGAAPNAAHHALARLQAAREVMLVTQNVDDLLERAGARDVLHMHGRLGGALCADCGARWEAPLVMSPDDPCPECGAAATRPDVVWFGEMPTGLDEIDAGLARATLFVALGTSGTVYPAAGFVEMARAAGTPTLELNLEPSGGRFDDGRYGPASEIVPGWVDGLLA
ncbi:NAD-dependent deacetylase [Palleronia aestuarii]|uniref:NAD-dependent protein deacylase n=1 Tax=Palleronia aestuarii TaxID=568105 RepID=A0A2W7N7V0_9RHOB|nr:Sir2 family NAD-dependent protein deacetylase [Palleronia aestuarii]PZX15793.1 NAD-dependent deacetylase [Palleronia aestuarii]